MNPYDMIKIPVTKRKTENITHAGLQSTVNIPPSAPPKEPMNPATGKAITNPANISAYLFNEPNKYLTNSIITTRHSPRPEIKRPKHRAVCKCIE
jgi:hypothetical protein